MKTIGRITFASMMMLAAACSGAGLGGSASGSGSTNHAPPENTSAPVDALDNPQHPGIQACIGGLSSTDVDDALEIANDFKESCHELIVCGGLATNFGSAVVSILINAALGNGAPQITYKGNGVYETGNAGPGTTMDITTTLPSDMSFGKAGDPISFNLLDISTYFTGAKVVASASIDTSGKSSTKLGVEFTGTGPGVELLGLGQTPASPLSVNADQIAAALGKILIQTKIHVDDKQGHSTFTYDVSTASQSLASALAGDPVPFSLTGVTGARADTSQTLSITKWQINYLDTGASGYMNGTIGFRVTGGKYGYATTFNYPSRKQPDVTLACGS